jgi:voltage-gated potassium channel
MSAFWFPYAVAFDLPTHRDWLGLITFVVNLLDLLINFRVAFIDRGITSTSAREIARGYMRSGWFICDVLAIIPTPLDPLALLLPTWRYNWSRLAKLLTGANYFFRWELYSEHPHLLSLLRMLFAMTFCFHVVACGWLTLGRWIGYGATQYVPSLDIPADDLYLHALYWASSLLLGNPTSLSQPQRRAEMIFQSCLDLLAVAIFATVVGQISSIISELGSASQAHRTKMASVHRFLSIRGLPKGLTQRIKSYFDYLWSRQQGFKDEEILNELPHHLRTEVLLFLHRDLLQKVAFLGGCEPHFYGALAANLKPEIYSPGDYVITVGDVGNEMYFLSKGHVQVIGANGQILVELSSGAYFGEIALLNPNEKRTASVRSLTYCDVLSLSREAFEDVLEKFPRAGEAIRAVATQRMQRQRRLEIIRTLPLVSNSPIEFLEALVNHLHSQAVMPDVSVVEEGTIGEEMYFVVKGSLRVSARGQALGSLTEGDFFGEIGLLFDTARTATVRSTSQCELLVLRRKDFQSAIERFPKEVARIRQVAEQRRAGKPGSSGPRASPPTVASGKQPLSATSGTWPLSPPASPRGEVRNILLDSTAVVGSD